MNENSFFESIGNYFELQFDVELEFVEWDTFYRHMNEEELAEELSKHQPDIIISSSELHQNLARRSLLLELDHTLWDDGYLHQPVLDLLRIYGDGQLFGWAPYFTSEMLVYNPQIFLESDVALPSNGTRRALINNLKLLNRTTDSNSDQLYIHHSSPSEFIYSNMFTNNYQMYNSINGLINLDSQEFQLLFEHAVDIAGSLDASSRLIPEILEAFADGEVAAMLISNPSAITTLANMLRNTNSPVEWRVVGPPRISDLDPMQAMINLQEIYSINRAANNSTIAQQFISFAMSDNFYEHRQNIFDGKLPSSKTGPTKFEALYSYTIPRDTISGIIDLMEQGNDREHWIEALTNLQQSVDLQINRVQNGELSVDEAYTELIELLL